MNSTMSDAWIFKFFICFFVLIFINFLNCQSQEIFHPVKIYKMISELKNGNCASPFLFQTDPPKILPTKSLFNRVSRCPTTSTATFFRLGNHESPKRSIFNNDQFCFVNQKQTDQTKQTVDADF